jgi:hypothetical protein
MQEIFVFHKNHGVISKVYRNRDADLEFVVLMRRT